MDRLFFLFFLSKVLLASDTQKFMDIKTITINFAGKVRDSPSICM